MSSSQLSLTIEDNELDGSAWFNGSIDEVPIGFYLHPMLPSPPILYEDSRFVEKLFAGLQSFRFMHTLRCRRYGDADAEEWPEHHTPPEIRQRWEERVKRNQEWLAATPTTDDSIEASDTEPISPRTWYIRKMQSLKRKDPVITPPSSTDRNSSDNPLTATAGKRATLQTANDGLNVATKSRKRQYTKTTMETEQSAINDRIFTVRRSCRLRNQTTGKRLADQEGSFQAHFKRRRCAKS
ncbi:hypothetical protein MMC25_007551 [Agyrium rufum]|nr:hypothetical protein [Agyrium rufum]